ncbi:MAG: hypothetical protein EOR68_24705 [Mesorhizobium sp.]|uniref:hypothetical protein n=1 Tax=Mesorhizobium sp. TaxID=1871066 RepID=UPI000FE5F2ED|nr:hypothetical protein [Mesorhizobium sp.]RWL93219.1 MAG: hypothetical protein EOR68_24705 [Mesorhizobium sp.]
MSTRRLRHYEADRRAATSIKAAVNTSAIARICVKAVFWREFVLKRVSAHISEEETAGRGDEQAPTEGGPDKRPQCAARSGCWFAWAFSASRQCALFERNVCVRFKTLFALRILNIAGGGDGA